MACPARGRRPNDRCNFTVPGDGAIHFESLLAILRRNHYRGWLVVEAEQDPAVAPAFRYAEMGFRHLRGLAASEGVKP